MQRPDSTELATNCERMDLHNGWKKITAEFCLHVEVIVSPDTGQRAVPKTY